MAAYRTKATNCKGLDVAIGMIEKTILELERKVEKKCEPTVGRELSENSEERKKIRSKSKTLVRKKWKYIRDQFAVELGKIPHTRSGDAASDTPTSKWQYFRLLHFLKSVVKPRASTGNLSEEKKRKKSPVKSTLIQNRKPDNLRPLSFKRQFPDNPSSSSQNVKSKIGRKKKHRSQLTDFFEEKKICQFAKPTLCSQLKFKRNLHKPTKELHLPFVTYTSEGKSYNLGTLIQQNMGELKLSTIGKYENRSSPKVTREDVEKAVENLRIEAERVKKNK